jgi:hypothetical protein
VHGSLQARRRKLDELHHSALDVHGGIESFEINMKRLVRGDTGEGEPGQRLAAEGRVGVGWGGHPRRGA